MLRLARAFFVLVLVAAPVLLGLASAKGEPPAEAKGALPKTVTLKLDDGVNLELVRIDPGEFQMGAPADEKESLDQEKPRHAVKISKPFYLGKYELTRGQFRAFVRGKGYQTEAEKGGEDQTWKKVSFPQTDEHPVVCVSWNDAVACCDWLEGHCRDQVRRQLGEGAWHVKLPTEAQWEYACRAGTTSPFHFGSVLNGKEANCDGTSPYGTDTKGPNREGTTPGGKYKPNAWGLYDMHGNAWEWCLDYQDPDFYSQKILLDPVNLKKEPEGRRVVRGGSWYDRAGYCRAAFRRGLGSSIIRDDVGFRVALRLD